MLVTGMLTGMGWQDPAHPEGTLHPGHDLHLLRQHPHRGTAPAHWTQVGNASCHAARHPSELPGLHTAPRWVKGPPDCMHTRCTTTPLKLGGGPSIPSHSRTTPCIQSRASAHHSSRGSPLQQLLNASKPGRLLSLCRVQANPHKRVRQLYGARMMTSYRGVPLGELSPHVYAIAEQVTPHRAATRPGAPSLETGCSGLLGLPSLSPLQDHLHKLRGCWPSSPLLFHGYEPRPPFPWSAARLHASSMHAT